MSGADFPQPSLILVKIWGNFSLNLDYFEILFDFIVLCWLVNPRGWVIESYGYWSGHLCTISKAVRSSPGILSARSVLIFMGDGRSTHPGASPRSFGEELKLSQC